MSYKAVLDLQQGPTPAEMAAFGKRGGTPKRGFPFGGSKAKGNDGWVGGRQWPPKNNSTNNQKKKNEKERKQNEEEKGNEEKKRANEKEKLNDKKAEHDKEETAKRRRESGESGARGPESKGARTDGEEGAKKD